MTPSEKDADPRTDGTLGTAPTTLSAGGIDPTASGGRLPPGPGEEAPLPRPFGRYTLVRVLGSGGMGVVYLADDTELGRPVALKVLRPDLGDPTAVERFRREARVAAGLAHPNLCPVYDVGQVGGVNYLTMPFVPGESLAARVRRDGPLPAAEAVRLVRLVAEAVAAAHAAGVVHRDLKPGNVLLDAGGNPVVTDFGLARRVAGGDPRLTASGAVMGTPAYMPPEQIGAGPEAVGPACDVYSLGVILYELFTGRVPFQGTTGEVLQQVLTADPPRPRLLRPGLDRRLEAVCLRAMAKDPRRRFASMAAFADALADPAAIGRGRRRAWWAAGVAAAGLAVAAWAAWPAPKPPDEPVAPAAAAEDLLRPGSRWVGEFHFVGAEAWPKPVVLTVDERAGAHFRGRVETEDTYLWEIDGTLANGEITWKLAKALNAKAEKTGATGKTTARGRCTGRQMRVTTHDTGDGSRAEMTLTLRD